MMETLELQGRHLIQASAGTGKTHSLGLLVLRLVLEQGLPMPRLAVVTFTEAAARELAQRIASFLRQARFPEPKTDAGLLAMVDKAVQTLGKQEVARRLDLALQTVDQARISTIHGFCSRLLREFAFELGAGFGYERLPSEEPLIAEILADFWREKVAGLGLPLQPRAQSLDPDELYQRLRPLLAYPGLEVRGPLLDLGRAAEAQKAWYELAELWASEGPQLKGFLEAEKARFRGNTAPINNLNVHWQKAEDELGGGSLRGDSLLLFGRTHLKEGLKKGYAELGDANFPALELPGAIDHFQDQYTVSQALVVPALLAQAWNYLEKELPARKAALRVRSDNDLIRQVDEGLRRASARSVVAIRSRFDAVLIDEFQDTDEVQSRIFDTLFAPPEGNPVLVVMVGDPKQAIYGFRGGDIEAYLAACRTVDSRRRHSLATNFRSQPRLLDALNAVYERVSQLHPPFRVPEIPYEAVRPGRPPVDPLILDGLPQAPLTLWVNSLPTAPELKEVAGRLAAEIFRIRAATGWKASDFAILVSSHVTARTLRRRLARLGVLAVNGKSGSVLDSTEARELELVLEVLSQPSRVVAVRALLLSSLYGWDSARLQAWEADASEMMVTLDGLRQLGRLWSARGVAVAASELLRQRGVWAVPEGDLHHQRRVANFRQLLELLNAEDLKDGRLPQRTLARFRAWKQRGNDEQFEQVPEADEGAVNLVTMHHAKGLQWKVVFAVDLHKEWRGTSKEAPLLREAGHRYADFSPEFEAAAKAARALSTAQERLRLAYVTLTRAEELLYVVVRAPAADEKPDQWLFAGQQPLADSEGRPLITLEPLAPCPPLPTTLPQPEPADRRPRAAEQMGNLRPRWSVGSYTALTRDLPHPPATEISAVPATGIFAFPRGADAGTALHTVFERVDFRKVDHDKVKRWLLGGGISAPEHLETGIALVNTILEAPLREEAEGQNRHTLILRELRREDHAAEVEFFLSAAFPGTKPPLTSERLAPLAPRVGTIADGQALAGYLNGLMDLVFLWRNRWYILDWKSNHLGNTPDDYGPEALQKAMEDNHYLLQAHLYTVAWCRHLASSGNFDYERDFGGVFYVFLRGVDPRHESRTGLYFLRPQAADITTLGDLL